MSDVIEIECRDLMIVFQTAPDDEGFNEDKDQPREHYYTQEGHWRALIPEGSIENILLHWKNLGYTYSQIQMSNGYFAWIRHS